MPSLQSIALHTIITGDVSIPSDFPYIRKLFEDYETEQILQRISIINELRGLEFLCRFNKAMDSYGGSQEALEKVLCINMRKLAAELARKRGRCYYGGEHRKNISHLIFDTCSLHRHEGAMRVFMKRFGRIMSPEESEVYGKYVLSQGLVTTMDMMDVVHRELFRMEEWDEKNSPARRIIVSVIRRSLENPLLDYEVLHFLMKCVKQRRSQWVSNIRLYLGSNDRKRRYRYGRGRDMELCYEENRRMVHVRKCKEYYYNKMKQIMSDE